MIELTRLNGSPLFVNFDLIKWAEAAPDTMLTLINGEKVVVHESCAEVVERMVRHRVRIFAEVINLMPNAETLLRLLAAATLGQPGSAIAEEARQAAADVAREDAQSG